MTELQSSEETKTSVSGNIPEQESQNDPGDVLQFVELSKDQFDMLDWYDKFITHVNGDVLNNKQQLDAFLKELKVLEEQAALEESKDAAVLIRNINETKSKINMISLALNIFDYMRNVFSTYAADSNIIDLGWRFADIEQKFEELKGKGYLQTDKEKLTKEDLKEIKSRIEKYHDASYGFTFETLGDIITQYCLDNAVEI